MPTVWQTDAAIIFGSAERAFEFSSVGGCLACGNFRNHRMTKEAFLNDRGKTIMEGFN